MKQKYYIIGTLLCLALTLLGLHTPSLVTHILGGVGFLTLGYLATHSLRPYFQAQYATLLSTLILVSTTILVGVVLYMLYGIDLYTISVIPIAYTLLALRNKSFSFPVIHPSRIWLHTIPLLLLELILFVIPFSFQTSGILLSVWDVLPMWYVTLFLFTTFFVLYYTNKHKRTATPLVGLHIFNSFSLLCSLYTLGYGFDPFLHRAAQEHIMQFGFIAPKTPFYIGEYVTAISLSHLLHIPLHLVDVWLTPVLSALLLTVGGTYFFSVHKHTDNRPLFYTLLLPLFPLSYFTMTTPYNVSVLLMLFGVLITHTLLKTKHGVAVLAFFTLMTATVHPLAGVCLFVFVSLSFLHHKKVNTILFIFTAILSSFAVPALFLLYSVLSSEVVITLQPLTETLRQYISLMRPAGLSLNDSLPSILKAVYTYKYLMPLFFAALLFVAYKKLRGEITPFVVSSLVIALNVYGALLFVSFPNLGGKEQLQYAERLRHLVFLPLLPLAIYRLSHIQTKYFSGTYTRHAFIALCSLLLILSLYFTYPQNNAQVKAKGYNVTTSDLLAVQFIAQQGVGTRYVVLSNIMTAAAAVDQFGFNQYYPYNGSLIYHYSIPTGGYLADTYNTLLYTGQDRKYIEEVMNTLNVDHVYVLISDYWHNKNEVIPGLRAIADGEYMINDEAVMIFRFDRYTSENTILAN